MADLPQINAPTFTPTAVRAEPDAKEESRAEARLQERMQEELERVGSDPGRLRVTATLIRECRRDLLARGIRAEFVPTYLSNYFRSGNGSLIPRDDASAVNQALNEPIPASELPDPSAAGRDDGAARRGPDPRTEVRRADVRADTFMRSDPRAPSAHPGAAAKIPQPNTPPPPPVVVAGTPPPPPPPGSPPPAGVALGPDGLPLPATLTPGDAPVLTATGTPVALSVPGTLTEAPVEAPPPVRFFSMGHSFGPGRDANPEDMAALIERGRGLAALAARGGNMAGAPQPNPMATLAGSTTTVAALARDSFRVRDSDRDPSTSGPDGVSASPTSLHLGFVRGMHRQRRDTRA